MKKLLVAVVLISGLSQAAHIHSASYDATTDEVELDLTYGGCNLETFKFNYGPCLETYPAQTRATLDDSNDVCKAVMHAKLRLSLSDMGCRPAHMSIYNSRSTKPVTTVFVTEKQKETVVKVERSAQSVNVEAVKIVVEGQAGFPSAHVYATSVFSNSCVAARAEELVKVVQHADQFRTLILTVGDESQRICPMVYDPVQVTLDLGVYTKPNDGMFDKVIVNGKAATKPF